MAYIAVAVPSDIVYVAGTINGVKTVFEERSGSWYGYADAAEDSTYNVWVEMYDEAGNRSEYSASMYYELPWFVTDRTAADVEDRTAKGVLNARDLNRIEKNSYTIGQLAAVLLQGKTDWKIGDLPRSSDWERIRSNVARLRAISHRHDTPQTPPRPLNSWQKLNDLEQIQKDCFDIYNRNKKNVVYAGEIYAGEGGFL